MQFALLRDNLILLFLRPLLLPLRRLSLRVTVLHRGTLRASHLMLTSVGCRTAIFLSMDRIREILIFFAEALIAELAVQVARTCLGTTTLVALG